MSQRAVGLWRNTLSLVGLALIFISLVNGLFLFLLDVSSEQPRPYIGIFYLAIPIILIPGLILVPLGMIRERRRRRKGAPEQVSRYPSVDLNNPRHRRVVAFFAVVTLAILFLSALGSYRAYEATATVSFCGQTCHTVMEPEFTAYQVSPHAKVRCTECHVGPGAASFVQSKFSGVTRMYAMLFDSYDRPIPGQTHQLRPAEETCGQCHWSEKFFGTQLKAFNHFGYDEENTPRQIRMLIKTGGGGPETGLAMGIHWHMHIANEISYVSADPSHQVIPWVRLKDSNGRIIEYLLQESPMTEQQIAAAPKRRMDCLDCHNRSAHTFNPPDRAVDEAFLAGRLDTSLPYLKQQAVEVLIKEYSSTEQAVAEIARTLDDYYKSNYPDVYNEKAASIRGAISEVQRIFKVNFFPYMRVNWQTYPENIGHFYSAGCFRCHDGKHVSRDGQVIRKDCNICHTVLDQREGTAPLIMGNGGSFEHPIDLGDINEATCTDCHSGAGIR